MLKKTKSSERYHYIYSSVTGEKSVLTEAMVGNEWIQYLHRSDDRLVYSNIKNTKSKYSGEWNVSIDSLDNADNSSLAYDMTNRFYINDIEKELMYEAVEQLSVERRELFRLLKEGYEEKEIAEIRKVSQPAISKQKRTMIAELQRIIKNLIEN